MKTKEEWKQYFSRNYSTNNIFKMIINDKKCRVSYFYKYANEEHKKDKELNAFNFEKDGRLFELTPGIIDFEFIKSVYNIKKSFKIFLLPYEWKNNPEEKKFLEEVLTHHSESPRPKEARLLL